MTDLAAQVAAVLDRSILPSVIARGGSLRVAEVKDGMVTLEASGSPGAALPLADRVEALIRAAVPAVSTVRIIAPPPGPSSADGGDFASRVRRVLDAEINPLIAAHRGRVVLAGADQGWVRVRLEGGCQGCSLAEVTLRQGIEPVLRAHLPDMAGLTDVTDHQADTDPYFSPAKR